MSANTWKGTPVRCRVSPQVAAALNAEGRRLERDPAHIASAILRDWFENMWQRKNEKKLGLTAAEAAIETHRNAVIVELRADGGWALAIDCIDESVLGKLQSKAARILGET